MFEMRDESDDSIHDGPRDVVTTSREDSPVVPLCTDGRGRIGPILAHEGALVPHATSSPTYITTTAPAGSVPRKGHQTGSAIYIYIYTA